MATPDEAIHVELLWDTPGDEDQTDEGPLAGADLDLHFLHPAPPAPGEPGGEAAPPAYFDGTFDCYWFNGAPNAGGPSLDRDDTDGAGPENINFDAPEDGVTYRVGVYYWDDHGFGDSFATVRIYLHGVLAFERAGVRLSKGELWDVATLAWPGETITPLTGADGGDRIIPDYPCPAALCP